MSHCGLHFSSITSKNVFKKNGYIYEKIKTGTKIFDQVLKLKNNNILFHLHGRTHSGKGFSSYRNTTIMNLDLLSEH